jgi:glutathione S-transferase
MRVFKALVSSTPNEGAKAVAHKAAGPRLSYLNAHLANREFLLAHFSIADAALIAVMNWAQHINLNLTAYPAVDAYCSRLWARSSVKRAIREELTLLQVA